MRLHSVGRFTVYCMGAVAIAAALIAIVEKAVK
jgi:hypothetical protein